MPITTGQVALADGYTEEATIGPFEKLSTVQFTVANASAVAQVAKLDPKDNSMHWDAFETTFPPGQGGYSGKIYGVRFRNLKAGAVSVVAVNGYFSDDPIPFSNPIPFTGTLDPDGGYTPADGIIFDNPNVGGSFFLATDGNTAPLIIRSDDDQGVEIQSNGDGPTIIQNNGNGGMVFQDTGNGGIEMGSTNGDFHLYSFGGQIHLEDTALGILIESSGDPGDGVGVRIDLGGEDFVVSFTGAGFPDAFHVGIELPGPNPVLSFFGATPVVQQTATTLPQIIAALQAYGLLT